MDIFYAFKCDIRSEFFSNWTWKHSKPTKCSMQIPGQKDHFGYFCPDLRNSFADMNSTTGLSHVSAAKNASYPEQRPNQWKSTMQGLTTTEQITQASDEAEKQYPGKPGQPATAVAVETGEREAAEKAVLQLPPERGELTADLRNVNHRFFLMIGEVHRGILASLLPVPGRFVEAVEHASTPGQAADTYRLWTGALALYLEAFRDSRHQLFAAADMHGLQDQRRTMASAIESIEKILPPFTSAVMETHGEHSALATAAAELKAVASQFNGVLPELLEAIERSIERAGASGVTA